MNTEALGAFSTVRLYVPQITVARHDLTAWHLPAFTTDSFLTYPSLTATGIRARSVLICTRIAARQTSVTAELARHDGLGPAARLRSGVVHIVHAHRIYSLKVGSRAADPASATGTVPLSSSCSQSAAHRWFAAPSGCRWLGGRRLRRRLFFTRRIIAVDAP